MLNLFNDFKEIFFVALQEIAKKNNVEILAQDFESFIVEPAKEKSHGDLACNIAMTLSKKFAAVENLNNPRKLAAEIIKNINNESVTKLEIAGAGFINIFLQNKVFYQILGDLLAAKKFNFANIGKAKIKNGEFVDGEVINLEYASPNPTGPMHVGHTRGAIYGDVLANLLKKVGYSVIKEYYINDAGAQIDKLAQTAFLRYLEAMGLVTILEKDASYIYDKSVDNPPVTIGASIRYSDEKFKDAAKLYHYPDAAKLYHYPGEYLINVGEKLKEKYKEKLLQDFTSINDVDKILNKKYENHNETPRDFVVEEMISLIKRDLLSLGIKHDYYFSEKKELHNTNAIAKTIEFLKNKKDEEGNFLIYKGKLETPKTKKGVGATDFKLLEGYDEKDQLLFRSTSFGDDQDRVIQKADGTYTYFASDLAYILKKFEGGGEAQENKARKPATKFIMPLGFDHAGYVKRLTAAVKVITDDKAELKVILCQMVKFIKNGEPLKMSKRAGNFIEARDVIDQINQELGAKSVDEQNAINSNEITSGAGILRFIMLTRKNDTPFDFDLAKVVEQSKDNPIFYVQYAHARCCSVLRNLKLEGLLNNIEIDAIDFSVLQNLKDESELEIIKKIVAFPRIIEMAVANYEPHRIAFYLQELSATFHALWNKGVENPDLKFIIPHKLEITKSRIYLLMAIKIIIATGLEIFSIKALEELR